MTHQKINVTDLYELQKSSEAPIILDVRSEEEFNHSRIPGSYNIPLPYLTIEALEDLLESQGKKIGSPIYVTCASGPRAIHACYLLENDFPHVYHVVGCLNAWMENNFPIEYGKREEKK